MDFLYEGPSDGHTLMLAHSAGSAMDSSWMNDFCALLGDRGIRTARFEFAYMAGRRSGVRRPTPRAESVVEEYVEAVASVDRGDGTLFIGGKSYGGRVASLVADRLWAESAIGGLVCLGYPFHPPEKPEQLRTAHLLELACPTLVCQGTRDPFGTREDASGYPLSPAISIHWLDDGDHDLRPRKAISGRTYRQNLDEAADAVASFVTA